ncbi:MAG: flagellar hook assembly protein FlgD [Desulfobulbus sp.]
MSAVTDVTSSATTATSATKKQSLGQDQFLTLLVAQLQNQDPLNPTDATEFTAQLAQYSQLEQLFNLNDAMDDLTSATSKSQSISALSLIGQEVVVEGNEFTFDESQANLGYKIDGTVTDLTITVRNSFGKTVATLNADDLSEGNHFVSWDGKGNDGNTVAPGDYTFSISAKSGDRSATVTPLLRTQVTGVELTGSEPRVVTESGNFNLSLVYGAYNDSSI